MAGNFFDRLGGLFGRRSEPPPAETAVAEAPATAVESPPTEEPIATVETPPAETPSMTTSAPTEMASAPVAAAPTPAEVAWAPTEAAMPAAAASAPTEAMAPPAEPEKSAEELLEERLWAETDQAWARGDFQTVTDRLDALKALQPEDAAEIDQKIAAAQFNFAAQIEQSGDLQRALYLYQDAQRRNPDLGEASFAIERVQAALAPASSPAEAAPAEQRYTVEAGDSLWAIAEKVYGSGNDWPRILEANRDQIADPDMIQPGQTLRIP
jgi:nucleoid-associated protein YgaU